MPRCACAGDGTSGQLIAAAATAAAVTDEDAINSGDDSDVDGPIFRPVPSNITVSSGDRATLECRVENLETNAVNYVAYIMISFGIHLCAYTGLLK